MFSEELMVERGFRRIDSEKRVVRFVSILQVCACHTLYVSTSSFFWSSVLIGQVI